MDEELALCGIRRCEKCCGNCKHFRREYECSGCANKEHFRTVIEHGSWWVDKDNLEEEINNHNGAYGPIFVDEGNICDKWEKEEKE